MQIVAVQLNMAWEDKPKNHDKVRALLADTNVPRGALIILPEMFETGFSMNPEAVAQSEERLGEALLREMAAKYDCAVMGGVGSPLANGCSANHCVAFAPDGSELVRYQKMRPFSLSGEEQFYPAGDSHRIFEWQGVRIAPFVCYDLRFPEIFRDAVRDGAELITLIACWPARRSEHWVRLLQARAIENLACVIGVNRSGQEPGLEFDGRSSAFDHMGNAIFEADGSEQVLHCEFDIETMRAWREKFPALRDMQTTQKVES